MVEHDRLRHRPLVSQARIVPRMQLAELHVLEADELFLSRKLEPRARLLLQIERRPARQPYLVPVHALEMSTVVAILTSKSSPAGGNHQAGGRFVMANATGSSKVRRRKQRRKRQQRQQPLPLRSKVVTQLNPGKLVTALGRVLQDHLARRIL